jgi:hypothetical protein
MELVNTQSHYGTIESNGIGPNYHYSKEADERAKNHVYWTDDRLMKVTRLRVLSDPGFPVWDVSYCHGVLKDGTHCTVELPFDQIPKRGFKRFIVKWAKHEKVYAKGLGLLDPHNISTLC